jgi:hypothetical protein
VGVLAALGLGLLIWLARVDMEAPS